MTENNNNDSHNTNDPIPTDNNTNPTDTTDDNSTIPVDNLELNDEDNYHISQIHDEYIASTRSAQNQHNTNQEEQSPPGKTPLKNKIINASIIGFLLLVIFLISPLAVTGAGHLGLINTKSLDDDDKDSKSLEPIKDKPQKEEKEYPEETVAIGDSTIALNDSHITDWYHGCRHEHNNWAQLIGVKKNISCAGTNAEQVADVAQDTGFIGETTQKVYITVGSNSYRENKNTDDTEKTMTEMVNTIRIKAPIADIIFVGYLPAQDKNSCLEQKYHNAVQRLNYYHDLGNKSMMNVARATKTTFYDMSKLNDYNFCDENDTYIRVPNTTPGTSWHTTPKGHEKIAQEILTIEKRNPSTQPQPMSPQKQIPPVTPSPQK